VSRNYRLPFLGPYFNYIIIIITPYILILSVLEIISSEDKDLAALSVHRTTDGPFVTVMKPSGFPKDVVIFLTVCKARSVVPRLFIVTTVAENRTRVNTSQTDQQ
jgi:hypothetical protein